MPYFLSIVQWVYKLIAISFLIVALSIGYYLVIYLPQNDKELHAQLVLKTDQDNATKCAELGQKYFDANFSEYKNAGIQLILDGPYFHFNKKLQACLLEYKLMIFEKQVLNPVDRSNADYHHTDYILNLSSGGEEAMAFYWWKDGKFFNSRSESEYTRFANQEWTLMHD